MPTTSMGRISHFGRLVLDVPKKWGTYDTEHAHAPDYILPVGLLGPVQRDGFRVSLSAGAFDGSLEDITSTASGLRRHVQLMIDSAKKKQEAFEVTHDDGQTLLWPANGDRSMPMRTIRVRFREKINGLPLRLYQSHYMVFFPSPCMLLMLTGTALNENFNQDFDHLVYSMRFA